MIEFLLEILFSGLFELGTEFVARLFKPKKTSRHEEPPEAPQDRVRASPQDRIQPPARDHRVQSGGNELIAKLVIGVVAGATWGVYVATATDSDWPGAALSFFLIGILALAFDITQVSTERFADRVNNRFLRQLVTFTPQRFRHWAIFSIVTAVAILIGFAVAS